MGRRADTRLIRRLEDMSDADLARALSTIKSVQEDKRYNKIKHFKPDSWQTNAFTLGKTEKVRGIIAGNRLGKSFAATYELCLHLTGLYPEWWTGHRFTTPTNCLMLGESWSQVMNAEAIHDLVFGSLMDIGTGWLPKDSIVDTQKSGQLGAIAMVTVKHISGGYSRLKVGTYQSGDKVLMGSALDFVLIDECPDDKTILPQCVKRTWSRNGLVLAAFTPERGLNETVKAFWEKEEIYHTGLIHVSLFDSSLYTEEEKQRMVNSIPPWQRQFSIYGNPSAGQAAVFSGILKADITLPPPDIKDHWKRLSSIDFGFRDTNIVLFGTEDPATGIIYIYDELAHIGAEIMDIAPHIVSRQQGYIPMVYPIDGLAERGIGTTLIKKYEECGVITTPAPAGNWSLDQLGTNRSISPGIIHMRQLYKDSKLFISPKCVTLLREFDLYHYSDNGKFVDKDNHATDAARYLIMSFHKFSVSKDHNNNSGAFIPESHF